MQPADGSPGRLLARAALGVIVALATIAAPPARAQQPTIAPPVPGIPVPQPPFLPINQAITLQYQDAEGFGQITLLNVGPDTVTGAALLKVTLVQNGNTFSGSGSAFVPNSSSPYVAMLTFDLIAPWGQSYFFQGKTALTVELTAQGTYHPTGSPQQSATWGLIALPVPVPGGTGGGTGGTGTGSTGGGSSGIQGVALEGPISPVERPGVPNTRPLPGAIVTVQPAGGGAEIARQTADANGQFQIALNPGTYLVVPLAPQPGAVFPRGTSQTVTVPANQYVNITVMYDTGIR